MCRAEIHTFVRCKEYIHLCDTIVFDLSDLNGIRSIKDVIKWLCEIKNAKFNETIKAKKHRQQT